MIHNMGFREKRSTEHAILEITNQIKLTWIESCTPAEYLLIYKKLLTQLTTHYFKRNLTIMVYAGLWMTGLPPTLLVVSK